MKLHSKPTLRWVITLSLITTVGILFKLTQTVRAHGPLTGRGYVVEEKKGPHGGQAIEFGKNHLEFLVNDQSGDIVLFLLDKGLKTIPFPENYSGFFYLNTAEDGIKWFNFQRRQEDQLSYLEAKTGIKEIGPFTAVVSLKMGEARENFRFSWAPDAAHK